MKKIFAFVLTLAMAFSLAACGNRNYSEDASSENTLQTEKTSEPETEAGSNALIVYFSWSGNTEAVANEIQIQTGADIFEITPADPYTDDYDFSGKVIAPFVTSGGSGFSSTISAIESLEPDATVVDGLSLSSSAAENPSDKVTEWLSSAELTK